MRPRRVQRFLRKHRIALIAIAAYHFVFFFPTLFMSRVVSPNDVFYNYSPWAVVRPIDTQNSVLNDPPTAYLTLISLLKEDRAAFHWNPYVGGGIPGFGSSAAAVLSPLVALPALLLPLSWIYNGIIFLKITVAFFFSYLWLREERLGKRAAAIGAIVLAGSGVFAVRWLWQVTNATAFYPALLWIVRRIARGKRTPVWTLGLIAISYALSGFPATMAYGVYVATAYLIFLWARRRVGETASRRNQNAASTPRRLDVSPPLLEAAAVGILALLIASPTLVPFIQLILRSGYLGVREQASLQVFFPSSNWFGFIRPNRLGNPAYHNWTGAHGIANYVEACVYIGVVTLPLIAIAVINRRARERWFWLAALVIVVCCMFGVGGFPKLVARLPGFKYSALTRLQMLLPVPAGYLAAAGSAWLSRRRRWANIIAATIAIAMVADLAVFAGRFYPYLEPRMTRVPATPTIRFLQSDVKPFRIAPMFDDLWPNSAELFRLEDVRSHFSSEALYRRMLQRIDPSSWGGQSTVISFNSLNFHFDDPFVSMLGVRYFVEQPSIDIIKWSVFKSTVPGVKEKGALYLVPGRAIERTIRVDAEPFWAIELPVSADRVAGVKPRLIASIIKDGRVVFARAFTPEEMAAIGKVYLPLRPYARLGESATLRLQAIGVRVALLGSDGAPAGETPFFYGRVTGPLVFDRELPDGRLFRNLAEVPRFRAATRVRAMSDEALLASKDVDFSDEAVVGEVPLPPTAPARVTLRHYEPARQELDVVAAAPAFVASSEKLTPELRVTVDGREAKPRRINLLFAGVSVPAGQHRVVFERRIGRGWWWISLFAAMLWTFWGVLSYLKRWHVDSPESIAPLSPS